MSKSVPRIGASRKPMKVVYIAGKFRGDTWWEIRSHVFEAEQAALAIWKLGAAALCPHLNTQNFHGLLPDEVWSDGALELMRRCDAVFLLPNWEDSAGAILEYAESQRLAMPCFDDLKQLEKWIMR
jgi:Domain of unknown function (DUF4406)